MTARTLALALGLLVLALAGPARPAEPPLRFAVVGHLRGNATGETSYLLDELLEAVGRSGVQRVFLTGDLIWGDYNAAVVGRAGIEADWRTLDAALSRLGVPVERVPGNHDVNDPVTRDVWRERYGPLPRALRQGRTLFVLLSSVPPPSDAPGPAPLPRPYTRPESLPDPQLAFLRETLADASGWDQAFVFLHHVLWWEPDASWWRDVHPVLAAGKVRAVFGGDYGPLKFSHVRRDGIDYVQSAMEGDNDNIRLLRALEGSRLLNFQFDHFLVVTVGDGETRIDVRPVGALTSGKLTPQRYHDIYAPQPLTLRDRMDRTLGGPLRRAVLATTLLAALALGVILGRTLLRRRD